MNETSRTWIKIAEHINEIDFANNQLAVVVVNGKKVCLGKHADAYFAFAYSCPHAGGILADGYIDAVGNVVCPLHRYKFNMKDGRNTTGEGYYLKTWPVDIREEGVFVGMNTSRNLFGW